MTEAPLVTVLVPALNEEADIAGCIESIASQDYRGLLELVLVDGASDDGTVMVARVAAAQHSLTMVVVNNPVRRTSTSLNAGLAVARGEIVVRIDARSRVQGDYVRACVETLMSRPDVGVVGGAQVSRPRDDSITSVGIARALRNRWATGLARYRRSSRSGPTETVWMGSFRTAELRALGGWSPVVALNEDYELNGRYRRRGLAVWFDAALRSGYLPRRTLSELGSQYFRFGRVKGVWWTRGAALAPRHLAILTAPLVAAALFTVLARMVEWPVVAAAFVGAVAFVDVAAGDGPRGPLASRPVAWVAMVLVAVAWWSGVLAGAAHEMTARVRGDRWRESTP